MNDPTSNRSDDNLVGSRVIPHHLSSSLERQLSDPLPLAAQNASSPVSGQKKVSLASPVNVEDSSPSATRSHAPPLSRIGSQAVSFGAAVLGGFASPSAKRIFRLDFVNWMMLAKDVFTCTIKLIVFYRLVFSIWPLSSAADKPEVNNFFDVLGLNVGVLVQGIGDFFIMHYFLFATLGLFFRGVCNDNTSPSARSGVRECIVSLGGGAEATKIDFSHLKPRDKYLIYAHHKMHAMAYYSAFTFAVYAVNDTLTLKSFKAAFLIAKESTDGSCSKFIFSVALIFFQLFKAIFACFVIVFKLYFWASTIIQVVEKDHDFPTTLSAAEIYITVLVIVFDILSVAAMDYFTLMHDFHLTRILQGQHDSMIDIIASNATVTWYLNRFVYEPNYVKLQYLIKMSFAASAENLIRKISINRQHPALGTSLSPRAVSSCRLPSTSNLLYSRTLTSNEALRNPGR
eukprot:NODE_1725_length_1627_cov_107.365027_g1645_i0.p1 GENE.NODE_1725_length_1627_cov_107.365027_g1645_i0~~NODE_1725_length_1627_cov_107.365027_g1645_i0.p1  ORF type:complete len:457 (-),score=44.47 NODE_1725_length_1627_cov_107.365027_g1645_i0:157-1527(-)